ncbi:hypothetical protein DRH27_01310 [Candidatus Falkowbacteria bacterium]|nr:MAG: hypothetical protein DRH27_01310 [Candidatus Falkowbacteria bacterium]
MSHELEMNERGEAKMFYAGQTPWHGLGTAVETEITAGAAIRMAQLDWIAEKQKIMTVGGSPVDTHRAVVRKEDGRLLGVVGQNYEVIQNVEAFDFMDALVGEGLAMYHTAGSLYDGKRIFICCKMPSHIEVGPDKIDKYLVLATAHDGSLAVSVKWTPIRVVCNNTLSAAFSMYGNKKPQDCVSIRHTKNYKERISEAREVLGLTELYYERLEATCQKLFETPMITTEFKAFAKELLPDNKKDKETSKLIAAPVTVNKRNEMLELFKNGTGIKGTAVANTRWAAYNAVTEYADHKGTVRVADTSDYGNARMKSIVWGSGSTLKKKALALLSN